MSAKHKCRECSKLLPRFRQNTCILSWAVVTFGLVRFLTFGALKVCYDVDIFSANENTCIKANELETLRKWNNCFYWLLSGLHIAMTTEVALKLSKKYKSIRLYVHWPNVHTLTLVIANTWLVYSDAIISRNSYSHGKPLFQYKWITTSSISILHMQISELKATNHSKE